MFQYLYIWDKEEEKVKAIHSAQVQSWPYPERQLTWNAEGGPREHLDGGAGRSKLPLAHHKWSDCLTGGEGKESRCGIWGDDLRRMNVLLWRIKERTERNQGCQEAPSMGQRLLAGSGPDSRGAASWRLFLPRHRKYHPHWPILHLVHVSLEGNFLH